MDRAYALLSTVRQGFESLPDLFSAKPPDVAEAADALKNLLHIESYDNDFHALTVLSQLWDHGEPSSYEQVTVAKDWFVSKSGGSAESRAKASEQFYDKSIEVLSGCLKPRNHAIYITELSRNKRHWENGNITTAELQQKMAAVAKGLANDVEQGIPHSSIQREVQSALSFVSDETRLIQTMAYLWGGSPTAELSPELQRFDKIVDDAVGMLEAHERRNSSSPPNDRASEEFKVRTKREFISEARGYLGGLLQDQKMVTRYTEKETNLRTEYLTGDSKNYKQYKQAMYTFVTGPLQRSMDRTHLKGAEARLKLVIEEAAGELTSVPRDIAKTLRVLFGDSVETTLKGAWKRFNAAKENYLKIGENSGPSREEREYEFMRGARQALIDQLPEPLCTGLMDVLNELDSYLEQGFITQQVYDSAVLTWLDKQSGKETDSDAASSVYLGRNTQKSWHKDTASAIGTSAPRQADVLDALKSVQEDDEDTVKFLSYLWGSVVEPSDSDRFKEFCNARNKSVQGSESKAVSHIPTDCRFVVEARKILVERLPEHLKEQYNAQQTALTEFGMSATPIAISTASFVASLADG